MPEPINDAHGGELTGIASGEETGSAEGSAARDQSALGDVLADQTAEQGAFNPTSRGDESGEVF